MTSRWWLPAIASVPLVLAMSCAPDGERAYATFVRGPEVQYLRRTLSCLASAAPSECSGPGLGRISAADGAHAAIRAHAGSRLLVLRGSRALGGGIEMIVVFESPSHEMYYAWVYPEGDGLLDLRAFTALDATTEDGARNIEALASQWSLEDYWLTLDP